MGDTEADCEREERQGDSVPEWTEGEKGGVMRYLGVDIGYARCGWGIIDDTDTGLTMVECGVIKTAADVPFPERINTVMCAVMNLLNDFDIDVLGVEHPIHGHNVTNSVEVGAAYGAVLLAGVDMTIPTLIHFPTQVKAAVASGRASKAEVVAGVMVILHLAIPPKPDDAADGLAIAICTRDNWRLGEMTK